MLSSVLNNDRAIQVNIQIIRTFIRLRKVLSLHKGIIKQLTKHELKLLELDKRTHKIFAIINDILRLPVTLKRKSKPIGFLPPDKRTS